MNKEELKIFYLYDKQLYLVDEHSILKDILATLNVRFTENDVQKYIDKLISWYMVKYSDVFLKSLFDNNKKTDTTILDIMNFNQLKKSYGSFEEYLYQDSHEPSKKIILHKNLVVMAGWGLIYHKKSNPEFGYYRACQLLSDFNSEYSWHLPTDIYRPIFERDYSPHNIENIKLLEQKKKKHHEKSKKKRKKKKFFFH